jgi:hypothetical protein
MDDIILNGDPFDGDENTSQEDRRVRKKWSEKTLKPTEGVASKRGNDQMNTVLAEITGGPADPFTCYAQEILAKTIFRGSIPNEGPDREHDTPEMYRDKVTFHRAVSGAKQFREQTLHPLVERVAERLQRTLDEPLFEAITRAPKLVVAAGRSDASTTTLSDWSGTEKGATVELKFVPASSGATATTLRLLPVEAEYVKALHNLFHLEKYILAVVLDCLRNLGTPIENYTQCWIALASADYAAKPIREWEELTFIPFVDYMLGLERTVRYFEQNFGEK